MKRFYYFLKENPKYPELIIARDKNEVVSLLVSDMGEHARDQILRILSEEEFTGKPATPVQQINQQINQQIQEANCGPENYLNMIPNNLTKQETPIQSSQQQTLHETKYFEVNGENFKLENGQLF